MLKLIKVLIVDDSETIRDFLAYIFSTAEGFKVVGKAKNGLEGVEMAQKLQPDVITMDIEMPVMNGYEATREIMSTIPIPIVVVTSSFEKSEVDKTFKALDAGAVTVLEKISGINSPTYEIDRKQLVNTVRLMSEVKLVKRKRKHISDDKDIAALYTDYTQIESDTSFKIVVIGVSTGGPPVLNDIFSHLPPDFHLPIVVVQHIPEGFLEGMVKWLNMTSSLSVHIAKHNEILKSGNIYFCPPEKYISISKEMLVSLYSEAPVKYNVRPSVSFLFQSIADNFNHQGIGILLTGMGSDGAEELATMKSKGALTIAQDKESSTIHGMPGAAIKLNATKYILSPGDIIRKLMELNK